MEINKANICANITLASPAVAHHFVCAVSTHSIDMLWSAGVTMLHPAMQAQSYAIVQAKICTREAYQPSALFIGESFGAPWEVYQCPRSKWNHGSTQWSTRAVTKAARVRHKPLTRGTDLRHCRTAQLDRARCLSRRSFANAAHVSLLLVCLQLTRFLPYSSDLGWKGKML